jgi:hypothetical protein
MRTIAAEAPLRGTLLLAFDTLQDVYQALAAGIIDDEQASAADAALRVPCQLSLPQPLGSVLPKAPPPKPLAPPRRAPRSLDKARSIHRRRLLACSGPLPPALATNFTTSELAVLRIIGDECAAHGSSSLCVDAIAARAGTSRDVVQRAKRTARRLGLLSCEQRRLGYRQSKTTVIRIVSKEWLVWQKHHKHLHLTKVWWQKSAPTDKDLFKPPARLMPDYRSGADGQQRLAFKGEAADRPNQEPWTVSCNSRWSGWEKW